MAYEYFTSIIKILKFCTFGNKTISTRKNPRSDLDIGEKFIHDRMFLLHICYTF